MQFKAKGLARDSLFPASANTHFCSSLFAELGKPTQRLTCSTLCSDLLAKHALFEIVAAKNKLSVQSQRLALLVVSVKSGGGIVFEWSVGAWTIHSVQ